TRSYGDWSSDVCSSDLDYDVDGVCSTALAVRSLRGLGVDVRPRLPSRMEEGYGLSPRTVEELSARGARLLVTVDCGIGAVAEVRSEERRVGKEWGGVEA